MLRNSVELIVHTVMNSSAEQLQKEVKLKSNKKMTGRQGYVPCLFLYYRKLLCCFYFREI